MTQALSPLLVGAASISVLMAGIGMFMFLRAGARKIDPAIPLLAKAADALERQVKLQEQKAETATVLYQLREGQEQIRLSMSCLEREVEKVQVDLRQHISRVAEG